jgi:hypothetical protein
MWSRHSNIDISKFACKFKKAATGQVPVSPLNEVSSLTGGIEDIVSGGSAETTPTETVDTASYSSADATSTSQSQQFLYKKLLLAKLGGIIGPITADITTLASSMTMAIQVNVSFTFNIASATSSSALISFDNLTAFERI